MSSVARDRWAEWLAERRFGGDPGARAATLARLAEYRDEVLDRAELCEGETLLDVGCGEGMIGFGAFERGAGTVIFSDISVDLLGFCRAAAEELGVSERCRFVQAAAADLAPLDDASVDVVTTRSVLIYEQDKARAFAEFARVLRPGGRISLAEPINRFGAEATWRNRFAGYPVDGVEEAAAKVRAVFAELQPLDSDPMLDFDERDLLRLAQDAGFFPLRLRLNVAVETREPLGWEGFLDAAWNPKVPTLREAMEQELSAGERERLSAHLRPLVEQGAGESRSAFAYLSGVRR